MSNSAIVLGGTVAHIDLIKLLQDRGYYVILIDYLLNPPAKNIADKHVLKSTLNFDEVLATAKIYNAKLIISTSIDQANIIACQVAESLELPRPYTSEIAFTIGNKDLMKEKLVELSVPTARYGVIKHLNISEPLISLPLVVKPSDSNSSKGVRVVKDKNNWHKHLKDAINISRDGKAIYEEYIDGIEVGIDCVVIDRNPHILFTHIKRKPEIDGEVLFSIGSISPVLFPPIIEKKVYKALKSIICGFNLDNTPLLIQLIIRGNDIFILEFSPRIGGGLNNKKILKYRNFDIIDATIKSFLNIPIKLEGLKKLDVLVSENHLYYTKGMFKELVGFQTLCNDGIVDEYYIHKSLGDEITSNMSSGNRIASYIVSGKTINEIEIKIKKTIKTIICRDIDNKEIALKPIYSDLKLEYDIIRIH